MRMHMLMYMHRWVWPTYTAMLSRTLTPLAIGLPLARLGLAVRPQRHTLSRASMCMGMCVCVCVCLRMRMRMCACAYAGERVARAVQPVLVGLIVDTIRYEY